MARDRECEHDDRGMICPVCDESTKDREEREEQERVEERLAMFNEAL